MERPFDDSNRSTEKSLNDVLVALSKLEAFTEAMDLDELDSDLAELIRADHAATIHQPPLSDSNNNAIPSTINQLTHSEVQTSEQEQMRLFLRTPQFLPSFESFQRSVKQATVEGFAPKDLMNIPAVSKSSDGQYHKSGDSLISSLRTSQGLKGKDHLVNVNQTQFSGGSGQVKSNLTGQVEMSRPGHLLLSPSTSQGYQSNKLQSRPDPSTQESLFSNQSQKASYLPTTILQIQTNTPGVGPSSSNNQTKQRRYSQYEHVSAKGNPPNTPNLSSMSSIHYDMNRPSTPWIGPTTQNYQPKQMVPYHYQEKTKFHRNYPNQPYKVNAHSASTTNLVNALRGNSTQTTRHQNSAAVNMMKSPRSSNQARAYFYKKPYSQTERVIDGSKEVELRKRLAAPNIYSTQGSNSFKMQYASMKTTNANSTAISANKSLPRGYTHMTASSKSGNEYKEMASYIDLTDGNVQNNTGYYKRQNQQNNDVVVKLEKSEVESTPTNIIPAPKNKQNDHESISYRAQINTYNDSRLGYGRSQQIKSEILSNDDDNIQYPSYQPNHQSAVNITSLPPNQEIANTGGEKNNMEAAKNRHFGNVVKQRIHYTRLIQNTTNKNYPNYAYQNNNFGYGANEGAHYNDTYQNCAGQSNESGYVPNGNSWNYYRDENNTYDQNQNFPNSSPWNPNISGWYQQNNDFMYNTSSGFQQANQIITTNNSLYPVHQENNLHMNIYNFNTQQGYQHQEPWNGQAQTTPEHGTNSVIKNHRVESNMLILNRDILDLDQHQKQQRDLLIKIRLTRAIYNDQNSTEEEKHRRMADLLDSVFATPDGTNIARYLYYIIFSMKQKTFGCA